MVGRDGEGDAKSTRAADVGPGAVENGIVWGLQHLDFVNIISGLWHQDVGVDDADQFCQEAAQIVGVQFVRQNMYFRSAVLTARHPRFPCWASPSLADTEGMRSLRVLASAAMSACGLDPCEGECEGWHVLVR